MRMSGNAIKKLKEADAEELFDQIHLLLAAKSSISVIRFLKEKISIIEKEALSLLKPHHGLNNLQTIPGIGLVKNHKTCKISNWTWRGTDDFLGSGKRTWGRALSILPKAHQP